MNHIKKHYYDMQKQYKENLQVLEEHKQALIVREQLLIEKASGSEEVYQVIGSLKQIKAVLKEFNKVLQQLCGTKYYGIQQHDQPQEVEMVHMFVQECYELINLLGVVIRGIEKREECCEDIALRISTCYNVMSDLENQERIPFVKKILRLHNDINYEKLIDIIEPEVVMSGEFIIQNQRFMFLNDLEVKKVLTMSRFFEQVGSFIKNNMYTWRRNVFWNNQSCNYSPELRLLKSYQDQLHESVQEWKRSKLQEHIIYLCKK